MATQFVWYASYGSNLLEERFLCYIRGGTPNGSNRIYSGCTNKTLPLANEEILICSEMYFAKKSRSWGNGGVAFIKTDFNQQISTFGRMYLITEEQLLEVIQQENNRTAKPQIDFGNLKVVGSQFFWGDAWYGNIVYLGNQDGYPIFTFTSGSNILEYNMPGKEYLNTISKGIQERYQMEITEIVEYLLAKNGVNGNYTREELIQIL